MGKKYKKDRPCPNRIRFHIQRARRPRNRAHVAAPNRAHVAVPNGAPMDHTVYNLAMTIALLFLSVYLIFLVIWVLSRYLN